MISKTMGSFTIITASSRLNILSVQELSRFKKKQTKPENQLEYIYTEILLNLLDFYT